MELIYFSVSHQEIKSASADSEEEQIKLFKRFSETEKKKMWKFNENSEHTQMQHQPYH